MVFVLVIGDCHIPHRSSAIPKAFLEKLGPGKIQHILCTGNLVSKDTYDYLKTLASDVHVVAGDFDEEPYPEEKQVTIGDFKIGLCHGHKIIPWGDHDALALTRRKMDVDVLITGHTHQFDAWEADGCFYLNPGSATGAFSPVTADVTPSFALMDIQGSKIRTFIYTLVGGESNVKKHVFEKSA
eukprot:m.59507 g.59507  ORF g.59507 m.59507 type:complete len:184 (+) comp11772_c0_seq4:4639-5190(+)